MPLLVLLLAGCSDERASFEISNEQSLTVIVRQQWFWSKPELYIVVRGEPQCQREFFLRQLPQAQKPMSVYAYEATSYALLAYGEKYLFDVANCEVTRYRDIPDLQESDQRGRFVWRKDRFQFEVVSTTPGGQAGAESGG